MAIGSDFELGRYRLDILSMLPSLSSLHLRTGGDIDATLRILRGRGDNLVPNLKSLTLTTSNVDLDYDGLISFLRYRKDPHVSPAVLQSFHLKLLQGWQSPAKFPTDMVVAAFMELRRDGLDIRVSTREKCWPYERMESEQYAHFPDHDGYLAEDWPAI
ncbi:hypothetical protein DFH06DRAFT_1324173 [Mycena polygramma]|nr:hypothetical protein DFH06DRAFT_1324173 [Mycena polygramma]